MRNPSHKGGVGASRVFVLSKEGQPLMPCHPARARELLGKGRAVVARHKSPSPSA
ncbi:RRXRR domain-containing protein [Streptomyces sp. NPDC051243]|uniref:RRXRR domain-containing protein n=1 Tax=Streptomyces sp. NPDC051243 TaxID=3365646 RepID=UPI0037A4C658